MKYYKQLQLAPSSILFKKDHTVAKEIKASTILLDASHNDYLCSIRVNIRELKLAKNITNKKIALKAGISVASVNKTLNTKDFNPSVRILRGIARALECTLHDILPGHATLIKIDSAQFAKCVVDVNKGRNIFLDDLDIDRNDPKAMSPEKVFTLAGEKYNKQLNQSN